MGLQLSACKNILYKNTENGENTNLVQELIKKTNSLFNISLRKGVLKTNFENADNTSICEDELAITNPIRFITRYINYSTIQNALETNPNIANILLSNNLQIEINMQNVTSIIMSHLIPTAQMAQKIYLKLGHKKNEINYIRLTQAALLHDIGKVFIPEEILNKKGRLSFRERAIVELHNKLSYEILKTTNLHPMVAKLALEHHNYDGEIERTEENQVLTVSDVYSALREKRPYKKALNLIATKTILYDMGTNGKFDAKYISYI